MAFEFNVFGADTAEDELKRLQRQKANLEITKLLAGGSGSNNTRAQNTHDRAMNWAALEPGQGPTAGYAMAGEGLGRYLRGMFNPPTAKPITPEASEKQAFKAISDQLAAEGLGPHADVDAFVKRASHLLMQAGFTNKAMQVIQWGQSYAKTHSEKKKTDLEAQQLEQDIAFPTEKAKLANYLTQQGEGDLADIVVRAAAVADLPEALQTYFSLKDKHPDEAERHLQAFLREQVREDEKLAAQIANMDRTYDLDLAKLDHTQRIDRMNHDLKALELEYEILQDDKANKLAKQRLILDWNKHEETVRDRVGKAKNDNERVAIAQEELKLLRVKQTVWANNLRQKYNTEISEIERKENEFEKELEVSKDRVRYLRAHNAGMRRLQRARLDLTEEYNKKRLEMEINGQGIFAFINALANLQNQGWVVPSELP